MDEIRKKQARHKEHTKLSQDSLKYLDSILTILSLSLGEKVTENHLIVQVKHNKDTKKRHVSILRISTDYLKDKGLVFKAKDGSGAYNYVISLEGMVVVQGGGLLKRTKNEKRKDWLQKLLWIIALLTFIVNTTFQVITFFSPDRNTTVQKESKE